MQRRSLRLIEAGYYTEHGTPCISYKETLYRIFRRRSGQHGRHQNPNPLADPMEHNQDHIMIHTTEPWTPNTQTHVMSLNGTKTRRNMITTPSRYLAKCISYFFTLLLAFGFIHMQFKLKEAQQELQSLTQRMDMVAPLADAVPNFALGSQGAEVLEHLSVDTYWPCRNPRLWDRIFYWRYSSKTQQRVIQGQSALRPGQCWCFPGDRGHLFISLSHPVSISHVTLGHIQKSQAPGGYIGSAPREFSIYGMKTADSTAEEGTYLGTLAYDLDGAAFQTFRLSNPDNGVFRYVKLQVENNWGNIDYTCLYSFRVHADTVKGPGE